MDIEAEDVNHGQTPLRKGPMADRGWPGRREPALAVGRPGPGAMAPKERGQVELRQAEAQERAGESAARWNEGAIARVRKRRRTRTEVS
jgi:hypothetical protein